MKAILVAVLMFSAVLHAAEFHVSVSGSDTGDGSAAKPLLTIQRAAELAQPGDTITVHEGIYRERVNPPRGGTSDDIRIVYQAAPGEQVTIKGAEPVTDWEYVESNTWSVTVPNSLFGDFNPFGELIKGAWYEAKRPYHSGAVYLNGHWLKEAAQKSDVLPSEASEDEEDGGEELMNLERIYSPVGGYIWASSLALKNTHVELVEKPGGKPLIGRMKDGAHLVCEMDFGEKSINTHLYAASPISGGIVELRKGSIDGELIGKVDVGFTAEWTHPQVSHCRLLKPQSGKQTVYLVFKARPVRKSNSSRDLGFWFAEVGEDTTTIWADFKGVDPNENLVEMNVRQSVFYPENPGMNYITVRGFTLEQASPPWSTPTAEQIGLIGTHWSKGWVIEENTIRYSVCTAVTLGKYGDEHDHTYDYRSKTIPLAVENGWNRETVGHHLVRNNHIYNHGQAGIEGSMGCSFSTIVGNEIHDIRQDHDYGGCETAGIKFHGFVDGVIRDNHIYNCEHWGGIWLDWMAQGARVTGNLLHDNSQDLMFEVNHGPHLVDNNLLLSKRGVTEASGGGAFVHNLWFGGINIWPQTKNRFTPYFNPHSIDMIDSINIDQNDDRFYNNIFLGPKGTAAYDEHGFEITAAGNVFLSGAKPSKSDQDAVEDSTFDPGIKLEKKADGWWFEMNVSGQESTPRVLVTTELLGKATVPNTIFENRDGTPYRIDTDYFGKIHNLDIPAPGPFQGVENAKVRLKVWPKK